jgi:hypothetical protein
MTRTSKILSLVATICALPTGLLRAQSVGVAEFTTSFPFYISGQKLPAGSYMASMPNINGHLLLIRDIDSSHSAFVQYDPTHSIEPVAQGLATFHQYGDAYYLSDLTVTGEDTGMEILESTAEKRATAAALAKHEVASTKSVALQFGVPGY